MSTALHTTQVDLAGLMKVLGEALYSTPQVAVRELLQNAHDSCERRRIEDPAPFSPEIQVSAEGTALRIADNGAGLTRDEIGRYLATVGAGYTRTLRQRGQGEDLIGYFGLGFLSAFVVSERTEVWTCSYQTPHLAHRFTSRNGETYSIAEAEARPVGTEVRLQLRPGFRELGTAGVLRALLGRYGCLLRHPLRLDGGPPLNADLPPWRLGPEVSALRRRTLALEFAQRFERSFAPIATLPVGGSDSTVQGLLWLQDGGSYATSDNRNVVVFVRGMLIGEDERDLLPRWAGFVGAVLESRELQPTASREALLKDAAYDRAAQQVREALVAGLHELARQEPAAWRRVLARHNEALLGAALGDPRLFELLADQLTLPTTEGDLTVAEILARAQQRIPVTQNDRAGVESILFRALRLPVVLGTRFAALPFCQLYAERRRGSLMLLGTQGGEALLFQPAGLPPAQVEQLAAWFGSADREVRVRRFEPDFLPFVLVSDRDVALKRRIEADAADRRLSQAVLGLARSYTAGIAAAAGLRMYLNAACPVIQALLCASPEQRTRALPLLQPLVALLADGESKADIEGALRAYGATLVALLAGDPA